MIELSALTSSELLRDCSAQDVDALAALFKSKRMEEGTTVFVENMPGESLYLVGKGTIKVSKMISEGDEKILVILGPEDFFGEMALLDEGLRATTARVAEEAELLKLNRTDFEDLCRKQPELGLKLTRNMMRVFCQRIRNNDDEYKQILQRLVKAGA